MKERKLINIFFLNELVNIYWLSIKEEFFKLLNILNKKYVSVYITFLLFQVLPGFCL